MSNKGRYKRSFISAEEIKQQKSLEALEFSRSSGGDCHRRRVQMVISRLSRGRRKY